MYLCKSISINFPSDRKNTIGEIETLSLSISFPLDFEHEALSLILTLRLPDKLWSLHTKFSSIDCELQFSFDCSELKNGDWTMVVANVTWPNENTAIGIRLSSIDFIVTCSQEGFNLLDKNENIH